ncbi:MAG TPA: RNA-guided endonuclease IscB [Ktedonobacteraceae bacterium]|nr:RNA-guided endonuclease IscB [Ktedonobacteraceae bacterium]
MSHVFVVDQQRRPLNPVHPGRARLLLSQGKAAVLKRFPFTLILTTEIEQPRIHPLRIKLDPGSKTTGLAIINDASGEVVFAAEIIHRGHAIKASLDDRRAVRRSRRQRKTRYRKSRIANRRRKDGWLPPSLNSRVANVITWVKRLRTVCNLTASSMELVKFDLQKTENPDIAGIHYQQGTLQGYEIRQYLLQKWNRACVYCQAKHLPLQVEHIVPRAKGGTNSVRNLCLACEACNTAKGTLAVEVFLAKQPEVVKRLLAQAKTPLKDAAAVNTTRWQLFERLKALGLPVECGSGGLTQYNRTRRALPKEHWIDACCVGKSTPEQVITKEIIPLLMTAEGHGRRQMCLMSKHGFPRTGPKQAKNVQGFQTGNIVRAVVKKGKKSGTYTGRLAVRSNGYFNIATKQATIQGIKYADCRTIHRSDGYSYQKGERHSSHA